MPDFMKQVREEYKAGVAHTFLLHFNVTDLARDPIYAYMTMMDYLMEQLNDMGCDIVMAYDRSKGVFFPNVGARSEYQRMLGLGVEIPKDAKIERPVINSKLQIKNPGIPRETKEALPKIEQLLRQRFAVMRAAVIMNSVEKLFPNGDPAYLPEQVVIDIETMERWAMDLEIKFLGKILLLVTQNLADVSPRLTTNTHIRIIEVPLPDHNDRLLFINHLLSLPEPEENKSDPKQQLVNKLRLGKNISPERFAAMTAGLGLIDIHDLALKAEEVNQPISEDMIIQRKYESVLYKSRGILELIKPSQAMNYVSGLEHVEAYFRHVIELLMSGSSETPIGVLLVGPPGTGKTLTMEVMAGVPGLTCVKLKTAREVWLAQQTYTAESWYGMYERDISLALRVMRSLRPVVVFIDEIDRFTIGHEEGLRKLLPVELINFMDERENRGRVLWVGATSRPDLVDPAFKRAGRFDDNLVYLTPPPQGRADILSKAFIKHQIPRDNGIDLNSIASKELPIEVTGADLDLIVRRSHSIARSRKHNQVTADDLLAAVRDFTPRFPLHIYEFLSLIALREVNSRAMIPRHIPDYVAKSAFDGGKLNKTKIDARLIELQKQFGVRRGVLLSV